MKKLLFGLMILGFSASCDARLMTTLSINNQTGIGWKVKIESMGKWITKDWKPVPKNSSISFDIDAKTFTAQLRSVPVFRITVSASKDIVLRKDFKNVEGSASFTIKENPNKAATQGRYYIE